MKYAIKYELKWFTNKLSALALALAPWLALYAAAHRWGWDGFELMAAALVIGERWVHLLASRPGNTINMRVDGDTHVMDPGNVTFERIER